MSDKEPFRQPTPSERQLLDHLLEAEFPGRDELVQMFRDLEVRPVDEDGCLELRSRVTGRARVVKQIPVEAQAKDQDGVKIHLLLHVKDGRPIELEVFKEDNSPIKRMPLAGAFELIVLPPAPTERRQ